MESGDPGRLHGATFKLETMGHGMQDMVTGYYTRVLSICLPLHVAWAWAWVVQSIKRESARGIDFQDYRPQSRHDYYFYCG